MEKNRDFKETILKKIKAEGLVISRIPKPTKKEFLALAEAEFADDYGMTLKYIWDNFKLFIQFINNFDIKLNYIISKLEKDQQGQEKKSEVIKMLSGRKVVKGGKKNEQIK